MSRIALSIGLASLFTASLFMGTAFAQSPAPPREPRATLRFDPEEFAPSSDAERELLYDADQVIGGVPFKDTPGTLDDHRILVFKKYLAGFAGGKFTPIALENLSALLRRAGRGAELIGIAKDLTAPPLSPAKMSAAIAIARNHAADAKDPKEALALLEPLSAHADAQIAFRADIGAALVLKALDRHEDALKRLTQRPADKLTAAQKLEREHGSAAILDDAAQDKEGAERTALEDRALRHLDVVMKACEADPPANAMYSSAFSMAARIGMRRGDHALATKPMELVAKLYPGTMDAMQAESLLPQAALLGKPAPALELTGLDGKPIASKDLKGKITLVDFWATTCPPCIAEAPHLVKLVKDLEKRPFAIVSISLDAQGREPIVRKTLEKLGMSWPQAYDGLAWKSPRAEAWGVNQLPAIFVVDENWVIKRIDLRGPELRKVVETEVARIEKKN